MARFFVGDLHLGHKKVAGLRYPESIEPLDDRLVSHHDMVIYKQLMQLTSGDQLWVFGDISSGMPEQEKRALKLLKEIKDDTGVSMHLIWGNHDSGSSIHRSAFKMQKYFLEVFDSVHDFYRFRFEGVQVLASHYPYARSGDGPDRPEARYLEYRLPDTGMPLIHAHTHQSKPHMDYVPILVKQNIGIDDLQQLCVSWDVRRGLTTEAQINQWIKEWKA